MERYTEYSERYKRYNVIGSQGNVNGSKSIDKLGMLEDLEEQGRLLILPCKIGDSVYVVPSKPNFDLNIVHNSEENNKVYIQQVISVAMYDNKNYMLRTCDGTQCVISQSYKETWFLNYEEAKQKLEAMKK